MIEQLTSNAPAAEQTPEEVERTFDAITAAEATADGNFHETIEDELDALHPELPEPHEDPGVDAQNQQLLNEVIEPVEEASEKPLAHV